MVDRNPGSPVEAELRRAVSTAYYGLFHLLIHEGTDRIVTVPSIRPRVARTFEHKYMRAVCQEYESLPVHSPGQHIASSGEIVPFALVSIAATFVALHEARHEADYDIGRTIPHLQAAADVGRVEQAFSDWRLVQAHPAADTFLAELWCRGIPKR